MVAPYEQFNFRQRWDTNTYTGMLKSLLPKGVIWLGRKFLLNEIIQDVIAGDEWQDTYDSVDEVQDAITAAAEDGDLLLRILSCFASELERLESDAWRLLNSTDPGVATDLLEDWEEQLGLPEACFKHLTLSVEERQRLAHAKMYGTHETTTEQWYIDYAASLGYTISIVESPNAATARLMGESGFGSDELTLGGRSGYSELQITINAGPLDNEVLKCAIMKVKQAHVPEPTWIEL